MHICSVFLLSRTKYILTFVWSVLLFLTFPSFSPTLFLLSSCQFHFVICIHISHGTCEAICMQSKVLYISTPLSCPLKNYFFNIKWFNIQGLWLVFYQYHLLSFLNASCYFHLKMYFILCIYFLLLNLQLHTKRITDLFSNFIN